MLKSVEQELEALLGTELSSLQEQRALLIPEPSLQLGPFPFFEDYRSNCGHLKNLFLLCDCVIVTQLPSTQSSSLW